MSAPKPIFKGYVQQNDVEITTASATEYWLCNEDGHSFYLKWWGNGWVVNCQKMYLCKDKVFKHKDEIPAFEFSHLYPLTQTNSFNGNKGWDHVFETKEEAVELFRIRKFPVLAANEEFYNKVYDILVNLGGAENDSYRKAFIFNFSKDEKFPCKEWRFQGKLGFGGKYRSETNRVDCYKEDETPYIKDLIEAMNGELKKLENEKPTNTI